MRRLPVIATIREAYVFTFTHLGSIIGLIWLPMVIVTVAGFFVTQHYAAEIQSALAAGNAAAAGPAALAMLFYVLVKLLFIAMMYAAVAQLALGKRPGGAMVHFSFGLLEWRLFRALFGLVLFLMPPLLILFMIGTTALGGMATLPPLQILAAELAFFLLYAGLAFVAVRVGALLIPVVATGDDKIPLIRSWTLSGGNFWRLLGLMAAAPGPVLLLTVVVEQALAAGMTGTATATALDVGPGLPLVTGVDFLMAPLQIGLTVGASVFAWRALTKTDLSA